MEEPKPLTTSTNMGGHSQLRILTTVDQTVCDLGTTTSIYAPTRTTISRWPTLQHQPLHLLARTATATILDTTTMVQHNTGHPTNMDSTRARDKVHQTHKDLIRVLGNIPTPWDPVTTAPSTSLYPGNHSPMIRSGMGAMTNLPLPKQP